MSGASIDDDQLDSTIDVCMALQGDALIEENEREKKASEVSSLALAMNSIVYFKLTCIFQ